MSITSAINYDDLRRLAKRRVPRIAFDFLEGGVDDERGLTRNAAAFDRQTLLPRYMIDASKPDLTTRLFGQSFARPFGIAPTGGASLFRQGADMLLARAAKAANVPFIISGAATATMEDIAEVARDVSWYQMYIARDRAISRDMVARAKACGFSTLVLSVDVPGQVRRERNLRNGFGRPMNPTLASKVEALSHPAWMLEYYTGERLTASNWAKYAKPGASADEVLEFLATQFPSPATWDDVQWIRAQWSGNFVIKGILSAADARRAMTMGVDGVMVSNHGGRQLDRGPSPVEVLPSILDAVGDKMTVMLDSGIRRGSDIVTALAMGARFCFVGRWTLYGVTAGGEEGARHALAQAATEVGAIMTQIGATDIAALGPDFLLAADGTDPRRNERSR
jgi:(S)-mandelate dehydrogenase